MEIMIIGANGRMGQEMQKYLISKNEDFVCIDKENRSLIDYQKVDVIIDFSSKDALEENLFYAKKTKTPIVIATTGHSKENIEKIKKVSKDIAILLSSNFSLMFNYLNYIIKNIKPFSSCDFVLQETHHKHKKDSPSGSTKILIKTLKKQKITPKVVSFRLGNFVGEHKIQIVDDYENLTFSHSVLSRQVFCHGAYKSCKFLIDKKCGLYCMENVFDSL